LLNVRGISAQYGRARVLSEVGFDVQEGKVVSVVGANGAGKSTLVKVISGMLRPTSGHISFRGEDITSRPAHEIVLLGIAHVPEGRRLFGEMTVLEKYAPRIYTCRRSNASERGTRAGLQSVPDIAGAAEPEGVDVIWWRTTDAGDGARTDVDAAAAHSR